MYIKLLFYYLHKNKTEYKSYLQQPMYLRAFDFCEWSNFIIIITDQNTLTVKKQPLHYKIHMAQYTIWIIR